MPELPEIATFAQDMSRELLGREIGSIQILQPKCLNVPPDAFKAHMEGARITSVLAHGKWLKAATTQGWLLLNLGMGGEILLVDSGHLPERWRLAMDLSGSACLAINFWWFGYAHYAADPSQHPMVGKLGPNAIDLSLDEFHALLKGRRGAIKTFLLDQDRIAGIGNVYVQTPLWRAKIHPLRAIPSLSEGEIASLWQALRDVLQGSVDAGGAPFELNLYGQKGGWDDPYLFHWQEGAPCPACGAPLTKIRAGSTASYICPTCQSP